MLFSLNFYTASVLREEQNENVQSRETDISREIESREEDVYSDEVMTSDDIFYPMEENVTFFIPTHPKPGFKGRITQKGLDYGGYNYPNMWLELQFSNNIQP